MWLSQISHGKLRRHIIGRDVDCVVDGFEVAVQLELNK